MRKIPAKRSMVVRKCVYFSKVLALKLCSSCARVGIKPLRIIKKRLAANALGGPLGFAPALTPAVLFGIDIFVLSNG